MVRKNYVAGRILKMAGDRPVGIYRLTSKKASGNFRQSAVWDIMRMLREAGCAYIVYEPDFPEGGKTSFQLMRDFDRFQKACGVIAANRKGEELKDTELCVYTRDLYEEN
jgi:UDPglucose 6-dehydrogenase